MPRTVAFVQRYDVAPTACLTATNTEQEKHTKVTLILVVLESWDRDHISMKIADQILLLLRLVTDANKHAGNLNNRKNEDNV